MEQDLGSLIHVSISWTEPFVLVYLQSMEKEGAEDNDKGHLKNMQMCTSWALMTSFFKDTILQHRCYRLLGDPKEQRKQKIIISALVVSSGSGQKNP